MIKIIYKYVIVIIIIVNNLIFSQSLKSMNKSYMDSLLVKGEFNTYADIWEKVSTNSLIHDLSATDIVTYDNLSQKFIDISEASIDRLKELSNRFSELYLFSKTKDQGEKANLCYERFLSAIEGEEYDVALNYYYTAVYFSNEYTNIEKDRLRECYAKANYFYLNGNYNETMSLINNFNEEDKLNPAYVILKDSLSFLYFNLEKKVKSKIVEQNVQKENLYLRKQVTISFEANYTTFQATEDPEMTLHHNTFWDYDINLGSFSLEHRIVYRIQGEYYISEFLSIGIKAGIGTIRSTSFKILNDNIQFNQKAFSIGAIGAFFLGKISLLRPYIRIETGFINIVRDEIKINPSNYWHSEYDSIDGLNAIYPQILAEFGSEFSLGNNIPLYLGFHIFFANTFSNTNILQNFYNGVGIRIGYNFFK